MAPESWKSVRGQNVSKTSALNQGGPNEVKIGLNTFGTRILGHQNPGNLLEVRMCHRPVYYIWEGPKR